MVAWFDQGSGIIIMTACAIGRPESTRNSRQLSNIAEYEPSSRITGRTFLMSLPKSGDSHMACRGCIQLMLPRSVLISPLWAMYRYGCARSQLGNVFVEKREWTSASADSTEGSRSSG